MEKLSQLLHDLVDAAVAQGNKHGELHALVDEAVAELKDRAGHALVDEGEKLEKPAPVEPVTDVKPSDVAKAAKSGGSAKS